jgi:hypothetical protein
MNACHCYRAAAPGLRLQDTHTLCSASIGALGNALRKVLTQKLPLPLKLLAALE